MQINQQQNNLSNISFKGYDARKLRGFLMATNYSNIANEMSKIGRKEGFDVFIADGINSGVKVDNIKQK